MKNIIFKTTSLTDEEVLNVAQIHCNYLNTSFLSQLGEKFLYYLYKSMNESESTDLIIAKDNNQVMGFITGATTLKPIYVCLIKNYFFPVTWHLIPHLIKPSNIKKIIEVFQYSKSEMESDEKYYPKAELLSIAVTKEYRGTGVSQKLYLALSEEFRIKGHKSFKIIVGDELKAAQSFYEKMGAKKIGYTNIHDNAQSIVLESVLS